MRGYGAYELPNYHPWWRGSGIPQPYQPTHNQSVSWKKRVRGRFPLWSYLSVFLSGKISLFLRWGIRSSLLASARNWENQGRKEEFPRPSSYRNHLLLSVASPPAPLESLSPYPSPSPIYCCSDSLATDTEIEHRFFSLYRWTVENQVAQRKEVQDGSKFQKEINCPVRAISLCPLFHLFE